MKFASAFALLFAKEALAGKSSVRGIGSSGNPLNNNTDSLGFQPIQKVFNHPRIRLLQGETCGVLDKLDAATETADDIRSLLPTGDELTIGNFNAGALFLGDIGVPVTWESVYGPRVRPNLPSDGGTRRHDHFAPDFASLIIFA